MTSAMQRLLQTRPLVGLAAFVAILTACRIAILIATPLNLGPDEAQYWSWSLTPAFGYFSKPPLIAWLIGASTAICGDGESCIRISSPLLHGATALLVFLAARTLYDQRVGLWSASAYALMPGTSFSSLLITTDVPLLFFWALALLAFAELRRKPSTAWAITFGVALGLGFLSKYAMLYFIVGIALAVLPSNEGRALLFSRWGMIAGITALATFAPNIVWNTMHSFATVSHTASNANWGAKNLFNFGKLVEFVIAQCAIIGPIAAGIFAWGAFRGWRDTRWSSADTLLISLSLPVLAVVAAQAFISRANANWAAPAFLALTILVTAWGVRHQLFKMLTANLAANAFVAIVLAALAVSPAFVSAVGQENSVKRLRGWNEAGRSIVSEAMAAPYTALLSDDREDMGSLFYYARPRSQPLRMWPRQKAGNEYESAYALRSDEASYVLFITRRTDASDVIGAFASSTRIATLETRLDSKRKRVFYLYALKGPIDSTLFPTFFNRPSTE
ncbi:MAG: glycosyltransferase family 39 protein [Alphaproteobacteria bacterium]|nr:glycosyltransferase family 39 protein [Alphaproteobacteria bacterium]